jgi:ACR3 family arsenite efflux pump ArsB
MHPYGWISNSQSITKGISMWTILSFLQRNLGWAVPISLLLGFTYGMLFDAASLSSAILPLTFLMVFPMMVSLRVEELARLRDWKLQATTQIVNFVAVPLLGWGIGWVFFRDRPLLATGLLLTSLLPTSGMTISWTGFAKGNVPAAVRMTIVGLLLGSVLAPLYLKALAGASVSISLAKVFAQISLTVVVPLVAGVLLHRILLARLGRESFQTRIHGRLGPISSLGVLGVVFVAMALKAKGIAAHPADLLVLIVPLLALYLANFAVAIGVGRAFFAREDAIALVYGSVMRNLSIALAIAMTAFGTHDGPEIALVISLAYVVQVQTAAWSTRFLASFLR